MLEKIGRTSFSVISTLMFSKPAANRLPSKPTRLLGGASANSANAMGDPNLTDVQASAPS